jgi:RNase P subunit RPR2
MSKIAIKTMEPFKGGNDNIMKWNDSSKISSKKYICHFCGAISGSDIGYYASSKYGSNVIYICTNCSRPTYFNEEDKQYPGALEQE